jgi:cystathionine gamma-lyase
MASHHKSSGFGTRAVHAGQTADPITGAVIVPISLSTTFQQASPGVHKGYEYSRTGNPTRFAFEENVAALEKGEWGVAFASGSATTASVVNLFASGDHIIAMNDLYGGTYRYFTKVASKFGLSFTFLDLTDASVLEPAITPNTKMLWIETPTNPLLKIVDIKKLSEIAHKHNLLVVVDNTFMTPYFQLPLELGADMVVHSVTKYLNGHSDVVMGIAVGRDEELRKKMRFNQNSIGAVPSPFDSFLAVRGTKTLHVRMERHAQNGMAVAQFLEKHARVEKVVFPGLASHPQHELAKSQMSGFGGMITFYIKGGIRESRQFLENLHIFALAESLGGVESLADHPAIMTHASVPLEERLKTGITDNLVRLSCGIEDASDLIADLQNALSHITDN